MRKKAPPGPEAGDTRIIRRFLWTRKTLPLPNGDLETRWFEYGEWKQVYSYWGRDFDWDENRWYDAYTWRTTHWIDEESE